jgi:hypothetical protein
LRVGIEVDAVRVAAAHVDEPIDAQDGATLVVIDVVRVSLKLFLAGT